MTKIKLISWAEIDCQKVMKISIAEVDQLK
jgi:hypothetical protein